MASTENVECAVQVNIDDGPEGVGGYAQRGRHEIPGSAGDDDVERAKGRDRRVERRASDGVVSDVTRKIERARPNFGGRRLRLRRIAPGDRDLRTECCEALGNPQIDAAGPSC